MILTLPYPISANRYWQHGVAKDRAGRGMGHVVTFVTKEAERYKRQVRIAAYDQGIRDPLKCRVSFAVRLYPHRPLDWQKRVRANAELWDDTVECLDLDNCLKVLIDALKKTAYVDDKQIRELSAQRMEPDALEKRVIVCVEPWVRFSPQPLLALGGCGYCGKPECPGVEAHVGAGATAQ